MRKKVKSPKKQVTESAVLETKLNCGSVNLGNGQHQGARSYQEDSLGFSSISEAVILRKGLLAVLADGMGGLKNGKAVSDAVVSSLLTWFNSENTVCTSGRDLKNTVSIMNERICDMYCKSGKVEAGSTMVATLINNGVLHWLCIGDSRIYLKRNGKMYQINEDHDYLNQLLDDVIENTMHLRDALTDRQKDSLVGCIGNREFKSYDYSKRGFRLQNGDIIVLCSDGIYNAISSTEFAANVTSSAMDSCSNIIKLVASKKHPNQDNNSIVIVSYKE